MYIILIYDIGGEAAPEAGESKGPPAQRAKQRLEANEISQSGMNKKEERAERNT